MSRYSGRYTTAGGGGGGTAATIAFTPGGSISATNVQAAILEAAAESGAGGGGVVDAVVAGTGISVDATDPANPILAIQSSVYRAGGTDVAVTDGGTGSSTSSGARTNLGLVIGTNVQAWDADLDAVAALTTTSFGRGLLTQADAAALRTTTGLGTAAVVNTGTSSGDVPLLSTGGVLPIARVATGTPTGTKFVRDDGTLAVPAGGGSGVVEAIVAGDDISVDDTDPANPIVGVAAGAFDPAGSAAAAQAASQPLDSDLTAIAALTTTSFGRALLSLADAAAGRTSLGLGTAATQATGAFDAAGAAAAAQAASQPLDSDLTAIAALTTTSFGRSLLEAANAAALRTLAGLVLGSDIYSKSAIDSGFQPLDADLTAIAALTTTSYGRSVLATADAAALRTLAGIVTGPRELARSQMTTAQSGITTVTDLQNCSIGFTVVSYPVDVILGAPWVAASAAGQANAHIEIYDTTNSAIKQYALASMYAASAYSTTPIAVERITTPGPYVRKGRIVRDTGTGTLSVGVGTAEAATGAWIKAVEVAT